MEFFALDGPHPAMRPALPRQSLTVPYLTTNRSESLGPATLACTLLIYEKCSLEYKINGLGRKLVWRKAAWKIGSTRLWGYFGPRNAFPCSSFTVLLRALRSRGSCWPFPIPALRCCCWKRYDGDLSSSDLIEVVKGQGEVDGM